MMRASDPELHPMALERLENARKSRRQQIGGWIGVLMSVAAFARGIMLDNEAWLIAAFFGVAFSCERISLAELKSLLPWREN